MVGWDPRFYEKVLREVGGHAWVPTYMWVKGVLNSEIKEFSAFRRGG